MNIPKRYENVKYEDISEDLKKLVNDMLITKKGIFIHGPVGTGKTHILWAIRKRFFEINTENRLKGSYATIGSMLWNTTELLHEIKQEYNTKSNEWDSMGDAKNHEGILFLDDIGAEKLTEWVLETFYLIINGRYENMRPTVFTSNLSIAELAEKIGDRTTSRIVEMCEVYEIKGKDRRLS
jgi:DNA replication protein DnaC